MRKMKKALSILLVVCFMITILPMQAFGATATKISKCTVTISKTSYNYTGSACKPNVVVKYNRTTLKKGRDYTVVYTNNVNPGTATVKITGKGKYTGSVTKKFTIKNALSVTLSKKLYTYSGKANKPSVTVKSGKTKLASKYYTVTYKNNTKVGTAEVIVKGKGKYKGKNARVTFKIAAKSLTKTTVTLSKSSYTYSGSANKPSVTVKDGTKVLKNGTDYSVSYVNNVNAGKATVKVVGKGNYTGTVNKSFTINKKTIASSWVSLSASSFEYTGQQIKPKVTVKNGTKTLISGTDYTLTYSNNINAGTATVTVIGKGNYTGTVKKLFTIHKKTIESSWVSLSESNFEYTGQQIEPQVTVQDGTKTLISGTDYTIIYSDNINEGTATVTVTGKGNYTGSVSKQFSIINIITITPTSMELKSGERNYIIVQNNSQNLTVTYESEDTAIATVDRVGEVVANDRPGTTRIKVTVGTTILFCSVTVTNDKPEEPKDPNTFELSCETPASYWGEFAVASLGEHLRESDGTITWTSSDTNVIQICDGKDEQTKILDFVGPGTATISATDGTITEKAKITVKPLDDNRMIVTEGEAGYESNMTNGNTFTYGQSASSVIGNIGLEQANGKEFNAPNGMAYCNINGAIYYFVSDVYNNRVLCFKGQSAEEALKSEPAFVLGQKNIYTNKAGYGLDEMNWPMSVACDTWTDGEATKYRLYVADTNNNRILVFNDIQALSSGSNADYVIRYIDQDNNIDIGWPWSVATANVNGVNKLIITGTELGRVGIYDVPTASGWGAAGEDKQKADVILEFGISCTPRAITWTGTQLLIGDENIPTENGGNRSGFWVFNEFPTTSGTVNADNNKVFNFFPSVGYGEGAVIDDKLYLMYAAGMHIFNQAADGKFIESTNDTPDVDVMPCRESGDPRYSIGEGYFLNGGGTQKLLSIDGKLYLSLLGRDAIVGWTNPEVKLSSISTMTPDLFYGAEEDNHMVSESVTKYTLRNAESASDGTHMVVVSDLDCRMYVYKSIPTSSGAQPDYIYKIGIAPDDVDLYTDALGHTTLIVTNMTFGSLYIWEDYKFDGSLPNKIISTRIGNLNIRLNNMQLYDAKYDGTYLYLGVTENGKNNVYIYRGIPEKNDNYIAKVTVDAGNTYGNISSNGTYFTITDDALNNGKCGVLVYATSVLSGVSSDNPISLNESNTEGIIDSVKCGEVPSPENDSTNWYDCMNLGLLIKEWTDDNNMSHKSHEATTFSFVGDCVISDDGKVAVADPGNNRVLVWDSVNDAVNNTSNVTVLGHGLGSYDTEEMYGESECHSH